MPELQTVPARHGVATFVPAGQTIKIVNSSGTQVVDTWAFALPNPDIKNGEEQRQGKGQEQKDEKKQKDEQPQQQQAKEEEKPAPARPTPKKSRKSGMDLPSQEDAEKATKEGLAAKGEEQQQQQQDGQQPKKNTWSSYVPSIGWSSKNGANQGGEQPPANETEKQKNSRTWASYMPSGKGYSNYIPKTASDTVSAFASSHQRDPNKSYVEQLKDFSTTPVGAAGIKALSGSGYSGSLYAGYQAWNATNAPNAPPMEFLSMTHTRSSTLHLSPKVDDVFVSNLREPLLTLVEDTTATGAHDTLIAACDPARYRQLGIDRWEEHGSCAENLVLALKELNERAGLQGAKAVGADVTINNVPAPLNLFMNVPLSSDGALDMKAPKAKAGDFVRLRAERDVVIVMSSCPQDVTDINARKIQDAHFLVEGGEGDDGSAEDKRKPVPRRRPPPRKINSNRAPSTVATGEMGDDDKSQVGSAPAKKPLPKRAPAKKTAQSQAGQGATAAKKPAAAPAKKKPIPRPAGTPAKAAEGGANGSAGEAKAPVEKKKPRKLVRSPPAQEANGE